MLGGVPRGSQDTATVGGHGDDRHPQHAARVSERTGFFNLSPVGRPGHLIEMDDTQTIFSNPTDKRTEDYISGRFG